MNLPNIISISRIPLLFLIAGLLYFGVPQGRGMSVGLVVLGAFSDWLDGYLARASNEVTEFGKVIDAIADKILIIGLFVVLLGLSLLPSWTVFFILIMLVREFLITALRMVAATKGLVLAAGKEGKVKTGFQLGSLICILLAGTLGEVQVTEMWLSQKFYTIGMYLYAISIILTIQSGYVYIKRYGHLFRQ